MGQATKLSSARGVSRPPSPVLNEAVPSQVDAEVFNALPDDMKAEILAMYGRPAQPAPRQSPKRAHLAPPRVQTTPTKRGGIRGLFGKAQRQRDAQAGVMQTNFRAPKRGDETPAEDEIEELDLEFLAELPEDVRKEVIADHRRRRMALHSGLDAPVRRHLNSDIEGVLAGGQRRIQFPAPRCKVSFASSGVTSTREIKDMLDAWHSETQYEGPHRGDVEVLEKYLIRVILDESDLEKVVVMVKWLKILVEQDGEDGAGRRSWRTALDQVEKAVQGAVKQRGLAPLDI